MLKNLIKNLFHKFNFQLSRYDRHTWGINIDDEVIRLLQFWEKYQKEVIIFDVGSNIGQSLHTYKKRMRQAKIHSFEPSPRTFDVLKVATKRYSQIIYNNVGVGAENQTSKFYENSNSDLSSFLEPKDKIWGKLDLISDIDTITLDKYMEDHSISIIDFLKIDAQGFEYEILKGADNALENGKIKLIQFEIILGELYENLPRMDILIKYMLDRNYKLVAVYGFHNKNISAQWTDALFIHHKMDLPLES